MEHKTNWLQVNTLILSNTCKHLSFHDNYVYNFVTGITHASYMIKPVIVISKNDNIFHKM